MGMKKVLTFLDLVKIHRYLG